MKEQKMTGEDDNMHDYDETKRVHDDEYEEGKDYEALERRIREEKKTRERFERRRRYEAHAGERKHSSMHIAAFVLGIVSILAQMFYYICIPAGVLAIIFGVKSVHRTGSRLGKAGLILGIVGISICLLTYAAIVLLYFVAEYL